MQTSDLGAFATLDLAIIKRKLMHVARGKGWDEARANAAELEYRRFLFLMKKFPQEQLAPARDVDIFWHYHILDTRKYERDCETLFGSFLHHRPYPGRDDSKDDGERRGALDRMRVLYEATFEPKVEPPVNPLDNSKLQTGNCAAAAKNTYRAAPGKKAYCDGAAYCAAAVATPATPPDREAIEKTAYCGVPPGKRPASVKHAAMPDVG